MTTQECKDYLKQYRDASRRVAAAEEHREELRAMATRITPNYSSEGGGAHQSGDKLGAAVARIIDAEAKVAAEIELMIATKKDIENTINAVTDERLHNILYRRYICGNKWEQIAVDMNIEYRWLLRLHGRALQMVIDEIDH